MGKIIVIVHLPYIQHSCYCESAAAHPILVVVQNWRRLLVESLQPVFQRFCIVVFALYQRLPRLVVDARRLRKQHILNFVCNLATPASCDCWQHIADACQKHDAIGMRKTVQSHH